MAFDDACHGDRPLSAAWKVAIGSSKLPLDAERTVKRQVAATPCQPPFAVGAVFMVVGLLDATLTCRLLVYTAKVSITVLRAALGRRRQSRTCLAGGAFDLGERSSL